MRKPKLNDYQLDQLIGEGSTGSVWTGRYKGKGPLAIKCLRKSSINLKLLSDALVKAYKLNDNQGIANIYDFNLSCETPYITYKLYAEPTEFDKRNKKIRSRTLDKLCSEIEFDDVSKIALDLASAINLLHQNGIAHCNIKPTNILFEGGNNPAPKLSDFAQGYLSGVEQVALSDSLFFSPPEQLNGSANYNNVDGKIWDIYSYGATVYKLLTGEFCRLNKEILNFKKRNQNKSSLHSGITPNQVARAIRKRPSVNWPTEPKSKEEKSFRKIIEKCLAIDKSDRFSCMDDVVSQLKSCLSKPSVLEFKTLNTKRPNKTKNRKIISKEVTPFNSPITVKQLVSLALLLAWIASSTFFLNKYLDKETETSLNNPEQIVNQPINDDSEKTLIKDQGSHSTFDETKLEYLFNDLQQSQAALNEICQMIVKRDSEGNALYTFPEGTIGTILTYYEKFIERKEEEPALRDSVITALTNSSELNLLLGDYDAASKKLKTAANYLENDEIGGGGSNEIILKKAKIYENLSTSLFGSRKYTAATQASKKSYDLIFSIHSKEIENKDIARQMAEKSLALSKNYLKINDLELSKTNAEQSIAILNKITDDQLPLENDEYLYALANFQLGGILSLEENYLKARELLQLSIEQFSGLVTAFPENINYQYQLARALGEEAENSFITGDPNAVVINNDAIELLKNLINNDEREIFKFELARRLHSFSKSLISEGESSAARTQANSALATLKEIRKSKPSNIEYQNKTSEIYRMLAELHKEAGDNKKTIEYSREALNLAEILLEKDRDVENNNKKKTKHLLKIARDHGLLGWNLVNLKDDSELSEASECFKESQKHYKEILSYEPENKDAQQGLQWSIDCLSQIPKDSF